METWIKNALKVYWKLGLFIAAIVYMVTTTVLLVVTRREVSNVRAQCRLEIAAITEKYMEETAERLQRDV